MQDFVVFTLARVKPEVAVLTLLSLSQIGLVTYLATRDLVDLISGKSDISRQPSLLGSKKGSGPRSPSATEGKVFWVKLISQQRCLAADTSAAFSTATLYYALLKLSFEDKF